MPTRGATSRSPGSRGPRRGALRHDRREGAAEGLTNRQGLSHASPDIGRGRLLVERAPVILVDACAAHVEARGRATRATGGRVPNWRAAARR